MTHPTGRALRALPTAGDELRGASSGQNARW